MGINIHLNFNQLIKIARKAFKTIPEFRQEAKVDIKIVDAMMSGLACMYFQDPSLLQFQQRLQESQRKNNLKTLFNVDLVPKESQMRKIIDKVESSWFGPIFKKYYQLLQRGKCLEKFQIFPRVYYVPIDGSQFFSSKDISCKHCLVKNHRSGETTYEHYVLQGGIMHPDCKTIVPFMPEQIANKDGQIKQDCEMNSAKRFLKRIHTQFPRLKMLIGGDALFSKQPLIEEALSYGMHYLFVAKPSDHTYMTEWIDTYDKIDSISFQDEKDRSTHHYEWVNKVPLNGEKNSVKTNFLRCTITYKARRVKNKTKQKATYKNSWVTDMDLSKENIVTMVRAGRCRWKCENECFNVMKNHGYNMEHNYGHGEDNMAYNFYLLILLAFFLHQILELTNDIFRQCKIKFGSRREMWSTLSTYIKIIVFETWESLLAFALNPRSMKLVDINTS